MPMKFGPGHGIAYAKVGSLRSDEHHRTALPTSITNHRAIMSNNTPDQQFWDRVNAVINLSNSQCDTAEPNAVTASTMYASARFNAFIVASSTGSSENMTKEKEHALNYFTDQFRKMLDENLDDFILNFDKYLGPAPQ